MDVLPTGRAWRVAGFFLPVANPADAIYGLLAIGALLAAESGIHETYLDTVLSAMIAALLYWLLHAYSTVLGRRLATRERLRAKTVASALAYHQAVVRGAGIPVAVLLLGWATGAAQATAVLIALWTTVFSVMALEVLAGVRARLAKRELALEAAIGLAMGLGLLVLKILLH